jgi:hypothetical protein
MDGLNTFLLTAMVSYDTLALDKDNLTLSVGRLTSQLLAVTGRRFACSESSTIFRST